MNFSQLKERIYGYLGFHSVEKDARTEEKAEECLRELNSVISFRYTYKFFAEPPAFLLKEPYLEFLKGSKGVMLCVTTLGAETDARLKFLSRTDAEKYVIFDACASALLECLADDYEKDLGDLSYRFCPGYGGSDVSDVKYIFNYLKPEKTGVTLTQTGYMLPSKSMAGILSVGKTAEKSCKNCIISPHCGYLKGGTRCYGSAKK